MNAKLIIDKISDILGVERKQEVNLAVQGVLRDSKVPVFSEDFKRNFPVYKMEGDTKSLLEDGEHFLELSTEEGPKHYRLVMANGLLSRFDLLPTPAVMMEEAPIEEPKVEEEKMAVEDRISALEAAVSEIMGMLQKMMPKEDEEEVEIEAGKKEQMMSKQEDTVEEVELSAKKFTGAPKDEAKMLKGMINANKNQDDVIDSVFSRMSNWDVKKLKGTI